MTRNKNDALRRAPAAMQSAWAALRRGVPLGVGLSLGAVALPGMAASVGDARTLSHLGEPLRVEIPLQTENRLEGDCVRISPPDSGNEDIPWVRGARATLIDPGTPRQRVVVTTSRPVDTPVLMLGIQVVCGVQISREYALLLDPPALRELAASTPEVGPKPMLAETGEKGTRLTREGETAASIASSLLPGRRAARDRLADAIVAANRASLGDGATAATPFPAGSQITIPDVPPPRSARPAPAQTVSPDATAAAPAPSSAPPQRTRAGRPQLRIGSGPDSGLQMSLSLGQYRELKESERERLRAELELLAVLDERIATQLELSDRLRRLEALQARLQGDAARLENELQRQDASAPSPASEPAAAEAPLTLPAPPLSSAPTAPAPSPRAPTPAESTSFLQDWWISGALVLIALGLAGWLLLRRRRAAETVDIPESTPTPQDAPVAQDNMEELFEPLNEADIWPERDKPLAAGADSSEAPRNAAAVEGALGPLSVANLGPASVLQIEDNVEEHDSAVELAEIMMSFGRVQGAAQTLADFIRSNPKQAVKPWIKLLEVYRAANMRTEFDALCAQLNKTFNVKPVDWEGFEGALKAPESLENLSHIAKKLCDTWGKRECQAYLHELLRDNRQGTRQGFPLAIVDEILLLLAILESHLGAYRPDDPAPEPAPTTEPSPETMPVPDAEEVRPMVAPLDFSIDDTPPPPGASNTALDFDIDSLDLSKTLHINLDELEPTQTHLDKQDKDSSSSPER